MKADQPGGMSLDFQRRALITAAEQTNRGFLIVDVERRVAYENPVARAWLNDGLSSVTYKDVLDVAQPAIEGFPVSRTVNFLGEQHNTVEIRSVTVRGENGEPEGAVVFLVDLTEQRLFEESRRDFIANVSHELKTPVGALGLLAETLLVETDPDVVERLVNRMNVEAVRVATVIDDLLSLSRIESGPIERESINARVLVDQAVNRVGVTAELGRNPLNVTGDDDAMVYASHRDVVSALHHLLENALKYSGPDAPVEVRISADGDMTEIAVTDHGIGIDQKYVERIFERFYRVDDARTRSTGGTGLGLSIVRHVVSAHGGDIRVASQQGKGSTFTVRFAATPSAQTNQLVVEGGTDG